MADNLFERQVRKELEDLRLSPDKQVWDNIHAELHKEKKRRWAIWLIALAALGGSAGLYFGNTSPEQTPQQAVLQQEAEAQAVQNQLQPEKNNNNGSQETRHLPVAPEKITTTNSASVAKQEITEEKKTKPAVNNSKPVLIEQEKNITATSTAVVTAQEEKQQNTVTNNLQPVNNNSVTKQDNVSKKSNSAPERNTKTEITKTETITPTPEKTKEQAVIVNDTTSSLQPEQTAPVVTVTKNEKKTWQLYGSAEFGMSAEIHSLRSAALILDASRQNIGGGSFFAPGNAVPPGGSFGTSGILYKTPSRTDGMSFGIGLQAIRSIGKKTDIGVSFGYNYYSSIIGVGAKINSIGNFNNVSYDDNSYYQSTDSTNYRNKHHFLTLGADFYRSFRLGKTNSLRWRFGTAAGILLATNVLHFDEANGILYKNNSLISTVQMNISTGLDLGFGKNKSFYIGPHITYFMGGSSNDRSYKRHIFNAAIRAGFAIPRRKK